METRYARGPIACAHTGRVDESIVALSCAGMHAGLAETPPSPAAERGIPLVDVSALVSGRTASPARDAADAALHAALRDVGFAYISQHAVPLELIAEVRRCSQAFFEQPDAGKREFALNEWHRGYIAPSTSTVRPDNEFETSTHVVRTEQVQPNQSESIIFLHELPPDDPDVLAGVPLAGPNRWPSHTMQEVCLRYMAAMKALAMTLVRSIARGLGVPENHFDPEFERPTEFLRLLRFWPQEGGEEGVPAPGLYGAAPHTDYGFLTLVAQDDVGGLEVQDKDGGALPPYRGQLA